MCALAVGALVRPSVYSLKKLQPYECGIEVEEAHAGGISVHFYLVAVVFLVFDVESLLLFPWALAFDKMGLFGFVEVGIFLLLLLAAYGWALARGALKWER